MENSKKTIIRVNKNKENPYVQIDKRIFEDDRLSWKAKGLLGYFLSRPDDWEVSVYDLINRSKDGRDSVYAGMKELREVGYMDRIPDRNEKGRIVKHYYIVFESPKPQLTDFPEVVPSPLTDFPDMGKPDTENPDTENPPQLINNKNKKELTKNKLNQQTTIDVVLENLGYELDGLLGHRIQRSQVKRLLTQHDAKYLLGKADLVGFHAANFDNPVGMFVRACDLDLDLSDVLNKSLSVNSTLNKSSFVSDNSKGHQRDERYSAFYKLFPDA